MKYPILLLAVSTVISGSIFSIKNRFPQATVHEMRFIEAAESGHLGNFKRLHRHISDINARNYNGKTALMLAAKYGRTEIVRLLLAESDIDVNLKSLKGKTALIIAAQYNHKEIVQLLLQCCKVDMNARDKEGLTAFMHAVVQGDTEMIHMLLNTGCIDINARSKEGLTALMYAVNKRYDGIVQLLRAQPGIDVSWGGLDDGDDLARIVREETCSFYDGCM